MKKFALWLTPQRISWFILAGVIWLKAYLIFWQFNFNGYLVAPSPDLIAHTNLVDAFLRGEGSWTGYPALLHFLMATLSRATSIEPLELFRIIGPYWLLVPIIPFYFLVRSLYEYKTAFWATVIYVLVSTSPLLNFADAQYPDILGYNIIGPFVLVVLVTAVKKRHYLWPLVPLGIILMGLAHHMSTVLLFVIITVSLIAYLKLSPELEKSEKKTVKTVLVVLAGMAVFALLAGSFVFGGIVKSLFISLLHFKPLFQDVTSSVLPYADINTLVPPFIEFVGFAGLGFCLIYFRSSKAHRFSDILLIVWVITLWMMSRSDLFVLPQRVLRELSLPLSIAAGVFCAGVIENLPSKKTKWLFIGLTAYLIVINTSQLFVRPFLLPDGLNNMVWFKSVDQEKYSQITSLVPVNTPIYANYSNPILSYKLKKSGYSFIELATFEKDVLGNYRYEVSWDPKQPKYIFIGKLPAYTSPDVYIYQFVNYKDTTAAFENFVKDREPIKTFSDDSKLYYIPASRK